MNNILTRLLFSLYFSPPFQGQGELRSKREFHRAEVRVIIK